MKRLLMLIVLVLTGCGEQTPEEIMKHVNATGMLTDKQAESLSKIENIDLSGLTSITDKQAESLSKVGNVGLDGLTSITDAQAEILSKVIFDLSLNGLTSITDAQLKSLSKITDAQAESLSNSFCLYLNGLTSMTDAQLESLSNKEYGDDVIGIFEIPSIIRD